MEKPNASGRIFYGWYLVAVTFVLMFMAMGSRTGFGVFVIPMTDDLVWNRSSISLAIAVGWLANGVTQPFIGQLYDRFGGRKVISVSLLLLGVSTFFLSQTTSVWFLILVFGLVTSTASGGVSMVTVHALLSKWFLRKRGVALSIATSGASAGALVLAPFAAYLILWVGWRITWGVLGALILVLALPLAVWLIKDDPAEVGDRPDGAADAKEAPETSKRGTSAPGPLEVNNWRDSYKSRPMWYLTASYFVCGVTTGIVGTHYIPYAIDRGSSPGNAALAFSLMAGLNIVGVLAIGVLADRYSRKNLLGTVYAVRGLAYLTLLTVPGTLGTWGFAVIAGFSWIATPPLTSALTADIYGLKKLGTLNGMTTFAHMIGGAFTIYMAGVLYDLLGAYDVPFAIAGAFLVGAVLASYKIEEKRYSTRYQGRVTAVPTSLGAGY